MELPDEMDDDLKEILGRPNFACGAIAHLMVSSGECEIPRKAEQEQAAVIYKLLGFYAEHGPDWRGHAAIWLDQMQERIEVSSPSN